MPRGAAVIRYEGKRGTVWRIKYADADGRQVMETVGRETDGWTETKAGEILAERLVDVRREGLRRPAEITVAEFARQWLATYPQTKRLKKSTTDGYTTIIESHLIPRIGVVAVAALDVDTVEAYAAACMADGLSAGSVNRHLNLLSLIVRAARRRRLLRDNPVELVDRPREPRKRWRILTPAEVASVRRAFHQLERTAEPDARAWVAQAAAVFTTVYGTGIRRGELLGLRWRHVRLADPEGPTLRIEETFVRNRVETPKSERSARTIPLGPVVADALFEHRANSAYAGDGDRVFCHPLTGARSTKSVRRHAPCGARRRGHHRSLPPVPRRTPHRDHQRGGGWGGGGGAPGPRRSRRPRDDAAVHRPRRRVVPRRGADRRTADVRVESGVETLSAPTPETVD